MAPIAIASAQPHLDLGQSQGIADLADGGLQHDIYVQRFAHAGCDLAHQAVLGRTALGILVQAGAIQGAGRALDRLANYYMDMAEDMFPVVEVDAGRAVEVILNRGASLRLSEGGR